MQPNRKPLICSKSSFQTCCGPFAEAASSPSGALLPRSITGQLFCSSISVTCCVSSSWKRLADSELQNPSLCFQHLSLRWGLQVISSDLFLSVANFSLFVLIVKVKDLFWFFYIPGFLFTDFSFWSFASSPQMKLPLLDLLESCCFHCFLTITGWTCRNRTWTLTDRLLRHRWRGCRFTFVSFTAAAGTNTNLAPVESLPSPAWLWI